VCGEAGNDQEGMEKAKDIHPNFIVLDLSTPVMNGLEAARILKRLMPAVPLIMFTSFITHRLRQEALAAGMSRVIAKEGPLEDLVGDVWSLITKEAA
jgi:DNA-binding NarL/FixJ family response regulator